MSATYVDQAQDRPEISWIPELTEQTILKMLAARRLQQVAKFRTTCSDCVPNL